MGKYTRKEEFEIGAAALIAGIAPVAIRGIYHHLNRETSNRSKYRNDETSNSSYSSRASRTRDGKSHRSNNTYIARDVIESGDEQDEFGYTSEEGDFADEQSDSADEDFYLDDDEGMPFPHGLYDRLRGKRYIRVIRLHKGREQDPLLCTLSQMNLDEDREFDAISYTWGDKYPRKYLFCKNPVDNGGEPSRLTITASLCTALVRFRLPHKDRWLWADAICINQKDDKEKSNQVDLMAEIYAKASRTLIWLGNDYDGARCLEFFNMLATRDPRALHPKEEIKFASSQIFPDDGYRPLRLFFGNQDWFSRRWVIQEVANSPSPSLFCGNSSIRWDAFVEGVNALTLFSPRDLDNSGIDATVLTKIQNMNVLWRKSLEAFDILDLLTIFHSSDCDRNRDRIYALMKLTNITFTPDYSNKSYEQIYRGFARYCVKEEWLDLLHCGPAFQHKHDDDSLLWPSWIPDWSQTIRFMPLLDMKDFRASGELASELRLASPEEIIVKGRILNCNSIYIRQFRRPLPKKLEKVHTWIAELIPKLRGTPSPNRLHDFAITLIASRTHDMSLKSRQEMRVSEDREETKKSILQGHVRGFIELLGYSERAEELLCAVRVPVPYQKTKYSPSARKYAQLVQATMKGRRLFQVNTEKKEYLGIGPIKMKEDDVIAFFNGARTPFVIRPHASTGGFRLIGDCYLHNLMHGEALSLGLRTQRFTIV